MSGLNIHVYPSPMLNESRLLRISGSIAKAGLFEATHLVGTVGAGLPRRELVAEGVEIVRLRSWGGLPGVGGKILRALTWQAAVLSHYRRKSVQVVNAHSVWMLPLCWLLSRVTGSRLFYNPHELETRTPTMSGVKRRAAEAIERLFIGRVHLTSVVNDSIAQWYQDRYRIPRPITVRNIPVFTDEPADLRRALGLGAADMLFIHTGRLTGGRSIEEILDAFERAAGPHVVFLGDGPLGEKVREHAAASEFVHWLPPVAPDRVVAHVRDADVALCLIDTGSLSYRCSSPNKLFEALAARTPPLCSDLVEARLLLGDLAERWVVSDAVDRLPEVIAGLTPEDVQHFRDTWRGLPNWQDEVAPLVDRYPRPSEVTG